MFQRGEEVTVNVQINNLNYRANGSIREKILYTASLQKKNHVEKLLGTERHYLQSVQGFLFRSSGPSCSQYRKRNNIT